MDGDREDSDEVDQIGYISDNDNEFVADEESMSDQFSNADDYGTDDDNNGENEPPLIPILDALLAQPRPDNDADDDSSSADETETLEERQRPGVNFDSSLPSQHSYLGVGRELTGRTILEEDLVQTLPLISMPGFVVMPNQVAPLTLFHPSVISLVKNVIGTTKTFGLVDLRANAGIWRGTIGTTAEIFEYMDSEEASMVLKLKARGRQRFRLLSAHRQMDGNLIGTVTMLPEVELTSPLNNCRLRSLDKLATYTFRETRVRVAEEDLKSKFSCLPFFKSKQANPSQKDVSPSSEWQAVTVRYHRKQVGALTPIPQFVWDMYDSQILVEKVHKELEKCKLSEGSVVIPWDPVALSWWVAANLPLADSQRFFLLSINCAVQRLRAELRFLSKCRVIICKRCSIQLADQSQIFSMSREGPQGAFVNPGGHVHETLTLFKAKNLKLVGTPSEEYSWFPGYAWTIIECCDCFNHIGWKFTALDKKLRPEKFYGFSRKSIQSTVQAPNNRGEQDNPEENIFVM